MFTISSRAPKKDNFLNAKETPKRNKSGQRGFGLTIKALELKNMWNTENKNTVSKIPGDGGRDEEGAGEEAEGEVIVGVGGVGCFGG